MSSKPQRRMQTRTAQPPLPFASYAQVVRMLLPLTSKVSFYDSAGHNLWISDGLEEPELRMHVEILLNRLADGAADRDVQLSQQDQPTYVFPVRDRVGSLAGAMAIVFRDLPANATYRRLETVEKLLAPLLDILSNAWVSGPEASPNTDKTSIDTQGIEPAQDALSDGRAIDGPETPTPLPALLRRTLALATHRLQCAFGAFVVTKQPFTLTHRASPDESDLAINAAIDSVREPMLKLMQVRNEALLVNGGSGREQRAPYKFLVLPLRPRTNQLAALLMLFRTKQDRDFTSADLADLMQIVARLSPPVLAELAPERPSTAESNRGVKPLPAAPRALSTIGPVDQRPPLATPGSNTIARGVAEPSIPTLDTAVESRQPAGAAPAKILTPKPVPLVVTPDAAPAMDARIREALRVGSFDLYAQRISPLRDEQRPARFEVLLRMHDADRLRSPASFFEAAEANTLLPELDRWVIRRLLSTLKSNAAIVRSGRWEFCVNIAAQSLVADGFGEFVVAEVCKSSIPAGLLVFEIAECDALEHQTALELLGARLRDVGCRMALDNCRAGLATFGPLRKWPISCVKIDGSLIGKMRTHGRSESLVRAVTELASSMGLETVAERVESPDLCDKLIDIGIDYAQGFHFGQPEPLGTVFRTG